jgi:mono/diheme cytochrome c family protein
MNGRAEYRPCGVAVGPDGSFYIGDTDSGRIWRVIYTGESVAPKKQPLTVRSLQTDKATESNVPSNKIFTTVCAACHMPDGRGVPSMQPSLVGSGVVAGDTTQLIQVLLKGPAAVLPADRAKYSSAMPPFNVLNDADLAGVINYIRARFAPNAPKVSIEQVATERAKLK